VIFERWHIAHIAVAVDDLEEAMRDYSEAYGIVWGPVFGVPPDLEAKSDVYQGGVSHDGLRAVLSQAGPTSVSIAPLELICAEPDSQAVRLWGCPDGRHYVHHICYYVEDVDADSRYLSRLGHEREWYVEKDGRVYAAYHRSQNSMRIELYPALRAEEAR
jgi:hypothetical protein